ncbi:MAG: tryptophan 2,3-dioxygenase family protein [Flavobacteriales bacterium]|nr:tryptophan 2,3-dioxygenase family protein [Flavobacteriales bacterium]
MSEETSSVHYIKYLALDKVLDAQHPLSGEGKKAAHEEMLFIIIHQTYELWFKQILHEIESAMDLFKADKINESNVGVIVRRMERVNKIMTTLVGQLDILETMTSLDFLDFRDHLSPASGFQSHQFRKLEVMLGLKIKKRHQFGGCPYHAQFEGEKKEKILELEEDASLFNLVERWLERIPFLNMEGFDFSAKYEGAVNAMLDKEIAGVKAANLTDSDREIRIRMIEENKKYFERVLSEQEHNKAMVEGETTLSYKATMSALLINLYRDQPILHLPYQFLRSIVELDHKIATWRFRHVQMVEKMLGQKIGTGGSSGQGYLKQTVDKHKLFTDLANISTLMISRSYLPQLPENIKDTLGFNYKK